MSLKVEYDCSESKPSEQTQDEKLNVPKRRGPKRKNAAAFINALSVFEFSTAYPFVYVSNNFKCFVCAQSFIETSLLRQHMNESHTFEQLKSIVLTHRKHTMLKVDVEVLKCKVCCHSPCSLSELKNHLKNEHGKQIDTQLQDNLIPFNLEGGESYQCMICKESFLKVRLLIIHMSVHFNNYSCEVCGSGFTTVYLLKEHLEVHENGHFPCDKCSKVFPTPRKLASHNRTVHLKMYVKRCPFCPERFNSEYRRAIHLQDVHNKLTKVHKCETCGRAFHLKHRLLCHVRSIHLGEKNVQCEVCQQRFASKDTLKRHMVIHTGEKKYKCQVCDMAFPRNRNLKNHLRLHENTTNDQCGICYKSFATKQSLLKHIKIHEKN